MKSKMLLKRDLGLLCCLIGLVFFVLQTIVILGGNATARAKLSLGELAVLAVSGYLLNRTMQREINTPRQ